MTTDQSTALQSCVSGRKRQSRKPPRQEPRVNESALEGVLREVEGGLSGCGAYDAERLRRRIAGVRRAMRGGKDPSRAIREIQEDLEAAQHGMEQRREFSERSRSAITFPEELPISGHIAEIQGALEESQVVVVCGETGSGKSTQLPRICLAAGRGVNGVIGHTQPRRIAARSIARRIASEMKTPLGAEVGYKVRFGDRTSASTMVKVMTDGVLLAEIQSDRSLRQYDTIIIDEAHERGLNIDFLLGYLRTLLPKRPELRVIVTSATIDPGRFQEHFGGTARVPLVEVSGRTFPVEVRYRQHHAGDVDAQERNQPEAILMAVSELAAEPGEVGRGDILVFLPGEREIRRASDALRKRHPSDTEILPLYSRLSEAEQDRVFKSHPGRRIVLATNVAETSLTVPGIRSVIDTGVARISRYNPRSRVQNLLVEPISQASCNQRAGRCGRIGPGVCIRLFSEQDYEGREEHTPPEIVRTNLAAVILQMTGLGLGRVERFPFLDAPKASLIREGYRTLEEIQAIELQEGREQDEQRWRLTDLGRQLARLPLDPRIGRMLIAATAEGCLRDVLVIAAALEVQDPRERPMDKREQADAAHADFVDEKSDFLSFLKIWSHFHERREALSRRGLERECRDRFLSYVRLREWSDIHRQIREMLADMGMRPGNREAEYDAIHRALLAGMLSGVARKQEGREYQATGGLGGEGATRFLLHPASGLVGGARDKLPQWILATGLVRTSALYARTAAVIEPVWIEQVGAHLLRTSHSEPQWSDRSQRVMALERGTLLGLEIYDKRRVEYAGVNPAEAREIFIHDGLVASSEIARSADVNGEQRARPGYRTDAPFAAHNRRLRWDVERLEAKLRRRDILGDTLARYAFYDRVIPQDVCDPKAFERWRKHAERKNPRILFMEMKDFLREDVRRGEAELGLSGYPDRLATTAGDLAIKYHLEPGSDRDGMTLQVPVEALSHVDVRRCQWLVPGRLEELAVAMLKTLPKADRRRIDIPRVAKAFAHDGVQEDQAVATALAACVDRVQGVGIAPASFRMDELPEDLRMRIEVRGESGKVLAVDRDIASLQRQFGQEQAPRFVASDDFESEGHTTWAFGSLPEYVESSRGAARLKAYPAIIDERDSVAVRLVAHADEAAKLSRAGVRRLAVLAQPERMKLLRKGLPGLESMKLLALPRMSVETLTRQLVELVVDRLHIGERELPKDREAFDRALNVTDQDMWVAANEVCDLAERVLRELHRVEVAIGDVAAGESAQKEDIRSQLERLVGEDFFTKTPWSALVHYPRYLRAIVNRLRKSSEPQGMARDAGCMRDVHACESALARIADAPEAPSRAWLEETRWLLEELRVSLFAQELGTPMKVSVRRIEKRFEALH